MKDALLTYMINKELEGYDYKDIILTEHKTLSPGRIHTAADETVFITNVMLDVKDDFTLSYYSATESRVITNTVSKKEKIEDNIITRHKGTVYFDIDTDDNYEVSYVKLKLIK